MEAALAQMNHNSHVFTDIKNASIFKKLWDTLLDEKCFIWKSKIIFPKFVPSKEGLSQEEITIEKEGNNVEEENIKKKYEESKILIGCIIDANCLYNSDGEKDKENLTKFSTSEHIKDWIKKGNYYLFILAQDKKKIAKNEKEKFKLEDYKTIMNDYLQRISKYQDFSENVLKLQSENLIFEKESSISNINLNQYQELWLKVLFNYKKGTNNRFY
jgi:hypothetical protein